MRAVKGFQAQRSRGYPSWREAARRPAPSSFHCAGSVQDTRESLHQRLQALLESATSIFAGARGWRGAHLDPPVGGRASEVHAAPGSDRRCQEPDASGSAGLRRAGSAAARPGRGGHGAGRGCPGRGGAARGGAGLPEGAGFGGGCFRPSPGAWQSAVIFARGGARWCGEGRSRPQGTGRVGGALGASERARGPRPPRCQRSAVRAR